jgi:hypothetical protein
MRELSRGGFLRRVGGGAVVAAVGLGLPAGALADDDQDRANVRLVAASKRLTLTWYTTWLAADGAHEGNTRTLATKLQEQEQKHYDLLAPVLGDTAPVDDDFDFTLPKSATASARAAIDFSLTLERLLTGIGIAAAGNTANPGLSQALARVAAADSVHVGALTGRSGSVLGPSLPRPVDVATASDELAKYLH